METVSGSSFVSDSDSDSDSGASYVSATPPRHSAPPPPHPKSRVSTAPSAPRSKSNPKPNPKPKPESNAKTSSSSPSPFPSADLSNPHRLSVNLHRPTAPAAAASFSRLVRSRRPSFDPSDFENRNTDGADDRNRPAEIVGLHSKLKTIHPTCVGLQGQAFDTDRSRPAAKLKRIHPNSIVVDLPVAEPPRQRPKCQGEGNFVRLNINGYGRRHTYKSGRGKHSTYSRYRRWRKKAKDSGAKVGASDDDGEGNLDSDAFSNDSKKSKYRSELLDEAVIAAREDPSDGNLTNLLKLTHRYDSFREGQLEAIKKVIRRESTMLVLPTGAGKSLCYQLPALILPGLTLVVSPLLALMADQLKKLPPVLSGGLLSSNQTSEESFATLHRLRGGEIKVLFVSPERFLNAEFLSIFNDVLPISLVVIDEAHCISEWSHNFRPSYLRLRASLLRRKLNVECLLAMTATATTKTLEDIMRALEIAPTNLIQKCHIRENLQLFVSLSDNRLKDLILLLTSSPYVGMRSIIVYCKFQAETDIVCKYLCDNNIPAKAYHSGIPAKNRSSIQGLFCSNKIRAIVATVAFGMGLDKGDVEGVIHYSLPESLEEYVQETGRAGRDGRLSYCHLLLDKTTYSKIRSLLYSDGVDEYAISKFLCQIFSSDVHSTGGICSLVKESTARKFDIKEEVLSTILTLLEIGDQQYLCLLPQLNVTCTMYFHKTSPTLLSEKNLVVASILKNCKMGMKDGNYVFDIPAVANSLRTDTSEVLNQLHDLKSLGEITYELKDPAFSFMIVKKPDDLCALSGNLTKWLSEVEKSKVQKLDAMFSVTSVAASECKRIHGCSGSHHTPCIQRKIMDYFCQTHNILDDDFHTNNSGSSPYLRADIKVFLQSNSFSKFTPRAVARIMHGISSPAFPSLTWSKSHFWGRYVEIDFPVVMEAAKVELMNFVKKGGE
ncbi:ATP-dependent DNA helicase Q-like 5 [Ananas comosus]|uniref:DNA 3'-5' helicase n=1 Tax=Ananas comosus TaxID=4615 RepID=A0A6P5H0K8_ANACO|nr:ATP-dependent DNA helicase Q-like 5 [Ananas comosus]